MPPPNRIGRPRKTDLREVVNTLLYMASSGGAWLEVLRRRAGELTVERPRDQDQFKLGAIESRS